MSIQQPPNDDSGHESIKIERNSRGYNYSIRVVKQEGQSDMDWIARLDALEAAMKKRYGGES